MAKLVQSYPDPSDLHLLLETMDYMSNDMLGIIGSSNMHRLLDTKIRDRVIQEKWFCGDIETKNLLVYSTPQQVLDN